MANQKELKIVLTAVDNASKEINKVNGSLSTIGDIAKKAAIAIGVAAGGFGYVLKQTTDASNLLNNSLIGLNSVANAFGQDAEKAKKAAIELSKDGLMSVKEAADGLKNLLATGFSLPEAINLMNAFKDSASFNRQASLGFGDAIRGATEGIKNQNSILVDNAGITKNLSVILKEQGFSQQDLMNVTSDASVRQALYNGLIKEASIFHGDAAKAAETLSGQQEALKTKIFNTKAAIGEALTPTMIKLIDTVSQAIDKLGGPEGLKQKTEELIAATQRASTWLNEHRFVIAMVAGAISSLLIPALIGAATTLLTVTIPAFVAAAIAFAPFFITGAVVGGLIYGIISIAKNWEQTKDSLKFIWETIKEIWGGATDWVKGKIDGLIGYFENLISQIKNAISWLDQFSFKNISTSFKNLPANLGLSGARALGGPVSAGSAYLVGERGPELFVPSSSGTILPNRGGQVVINITGNTLLDSRAAEKMGNLIINKLGFSTKI